MKSIKILSLLLFVCIHFCSAQDTTLVLKPSMLNKDSTEIFISEMKGWLFKQGNDTAWAKKDIDLTGWKTLMPTELTEKMADKDGRLEGWFRMKIIPDSTFGETSFGFRISTFAASDLYIDGKRIASFGNTGLNGAPYKENNYASNILPVPVNLKTGNEYTVALHVVDYLSPFPPHELKAKELGLRSIIRVVVPKYYSTIQNADGVILWAIFGAISAILSLLFWLLFFQNRSEKNLLLFSLASSLITILLIAQSFSIQGGIAYGGKSYVWEWVRIQLQSTFLLLYFMSIPFILARIFKRRFSRYIIISFILIIFFQIIGSLGLVSLDQKINSIIGTVILLLFIISSFYYVVTSWKTLKGAQWAIVIGLMVALFVFSIAILFQFIAPEVFTKWVNAYLFSAIMYLSFPFSLMIYVAMRFKEIIHDVQENAKQVVQMSEEKKEQAINQQKILQEEVTRQTAEIRTTLDHLKATQSQLIQSEKMASLGELTAGIAHEIQNPLNFVNNFSEVNKELLIELKGEIKKGNLGEINALADDVISNEEKINQHGKRADAIVKGMLQHSSSVIGKKEPTDINALADEYLRLAYHGLRAKDKSFSAAMETHFDQSIGIINIIPQDIGRVLLNLYNNAFFTVSEKQKQSTDWYEPTVTVRTKKVNGELEIRVADNGNGIPEKVLDKVFQPFFTTKPTGQGTGLGLSLSYDIVKAHKGKINIRNTPGAGAEFIITLPINV